MQGSCLVPSQSLSVLRFLVLRMHCSLYRYHCRVLAGSLPIPIYLYFGFRFWEFTAPSIDITAGSCLVPSLSLSEIRVLVLKMHCSLYRYQCRDPGWFPSYPYLYLGFWFWECTAPFIDITAGILAGSLPIPICTWVSGSENALLPL